MSAPNVSTAVARPDLRGNVYRQWDARGQSQFFIADKVCPRLDVDDEAGNIKRIKREEFTKDVDTLRQGDGGYTRSDFGHDDFSFSTVERGHEVPINANAAASASRYYNAELVATDVALLKVKRDHEKRIATLYQTTSNWGGNSSVGTAWSSYSSATPVANVLTAKEAIYAACGMLPNTIMIPWLAYNDLLLCDDILDKLGAQSSDDAKVANLRTLAQILDIPNVVVPMGLKDTADKGQTASLSQIWANGSVWVGYVDPNPNEFSPTAAANLHWAGDGSQYDFRVERYYQDDKRKWFIRARRQVAPKIFDAKCGYVLTGAHA